MKALKALAIFVTYVVAVLAGVIIGLVTTNDPQSARSASVAQATPQPTLMSLPVCPTEDDPGPCVWLGGSNWDGMTFVSLPGNHQPVTEELAKTLGDEYGQPDRDWSDCRLYPGVTSFVICPDGYFALS